MAQRTCRTCGAEFIQFTGSRPRFDCYTCNPWIQSKTTCKLCGKSIRRGRGGHQHPTCLACRQARLANKPSPSPFRVCPICRRTFEHNRRTYCSLFCKRIGARIGGYRDFMRIEGEYRPARWWTTGNERSAFIIGPPPPPGHLDVWTIPNGDVLCPDCTNPMQDAAPLGHECYWCGIRIIFL